MVFFSQEYWSWLPFLPPEDLPDIGIEPASPGSTALADEFFTTEPPGKTLIQFSSIAQLCPTLCDPMNHSTPGLPVHDQLLELLKLMSIESVMPSSHLILSRPPLLPHPIPPSIRVFSSESTLRIRWPKYWSFSFSISPSNEHPGLISFKMDWLDLLAVQGTLKSLLQHHSSKASVFLVQDPYYHFINKDSEIPTCKIFLGILNKIQMLKRIFFNILN